MPFACKHSNKLPQPRLTDTNTIVYFFGKISLTNGASANTIDNAHKKSAPKFRRKTNAAPPPKTEDDMYIPTPAAKAHTDNVRQIKSFLPDALIGVVYHNYPQQSIVIAKH